MSRDFSLRLAGFGFRVGLLLVAISGTFAIVFGTPDHIKQAARDSKLYDAAATLLGSETDVSKQGPDVQPAIESAAKSALSPDSLRTITEDVIDGTYTWMDGSAERPDFNIDLTPVIQKFTAGIGDEAAKRTAALQPCTPAELEQLRNTDPQEVNILAISCLPPGMTPEIARDQAVNYTRSHSSLMYQPVITADTLSETSTGKAIFGQDSALPAIYKLIVLTPWLAGILCICSAAMIFILHSRMVRAAYAVGKILFSTGLIILALGGLGHLLFSVLTAPGSTIGQSIAGGPQEYLVAFIRSLESAISSTFMVFGAVFAAVGGVSIIAMRIAAWHSVRNKTAAVLAQPPRVAPPASAATHTPSVLPMTPAPVKKARKQAEDDGIKFGSRPAAAEENVLTDVTPAVAPAAGPVIAPNDPDATLDKRK